MGWKDGGLFDLFFRMVDDGYQSYDQGNNALRQEFKESKRSKSKREERLETYRRINDGAFGKGGHDDPTRRTFEPWPGDDRDYRGGYGGW